MATKLTLRLDEKLIKEAKGYAAKRGKSVSALVADFFYVLRKGEKSSEKAASPTVASLRGILKGRGVDEDDYKRHLKEKYL